VPNRRDLSGFYAELVGNLVFVRKQAGLDQFAMADALGVTRSQVANIETLRSNLNAIQIDKWCAASRCSVSDVWPGSTTERANE
jgi:transcriptional regulator with XRE-family HTH domain